MVSESTQLCHRTFVNFTCWLDQPDTQVEALSPNAWASKWPFWLPCQPVGHHNNTEHAPTTAPPPDPPEPLARTLTRSPGSQLCWGFQYCRLAMSSATCSPLNIILCVINRDAGSETNPPATAAQRHRSSSSKFLSYAKMSSILCAFIFVSTALCAFSSFFFFVCIL